MPLVSKQNTFSNGTTIDATQVNADFDTLYNLVNGQLDTQNFASKAVKSSNVDTEAITPTLSKGLAYASDLLGNSCVISGLTVTKDGTIANQIDITAGVAYVKQDDGSLRRLSMSASTQKTVSASATYYLDLNEDGTWSFATGHSIESNYLNIASVTTDGSGNVSAVTPTTNASAIQLLGGSTSTIKVQGMHYQSRVDLYRGAAVAQTATTNTAYAIGNAGMFPFTFHSSEWQSNAFYAEFLIDIANAAATGYVGIWDYTAGAAVTGSEVNTTNTTATTLRSASFTLTDGHQYGFYQRTSNASYAVNLIAADLLVLF